MISSMQEETLKVESMTFDQADRVFYHGRTRFQGYDINVTRNYHNFDQLVEIKVTLSHWVPSEVIFRKQYYRQVHTTHTWTNY
jgi:hypothetical protein